MRKWRNVYNKEVRPYKKLKMNKLRVVSKEFRQILQYSKLNKKHKKITLIIK